ncbi:MAG: glycosyltransferase family 1 protein [Erythrobacter sp.]
MRIVINAFAARIGGGQTYLRNLLARLPDDPDFAALVYAPEGLDLPHDPRIERGRTQIPVTNPLTRLLWERFVLPRELRRFGAELLFCPGGLVNTVPPRGCGTATMFRNMLPFDEKALAQLPPGMQKWRNRILRGQMLRSMKNADLTIFISDFARDVIEEHISPPRAKTIPHGINEAFLTAARDLPRPAASGSQPYILYVSRFEAYKHHFEVTQAYAALPELLRASHRLLLVGETNYEPAEKLRHFIAENGLEDRIELVGKVPYEDLPAWYRNAAAIVFASSCENCPNILLESLGAGRPVIASDVAPMPEFGGVDLAYFSPYDPGEIARELERVLADSDHAQTLARAAARRAGRYDWNETAAATWSALDGIAVTT